ncbi:MAG: hypothetical protein F6J94_02485 [Moorea sp. SIO1F2]|uniref:hypothetical protein n=1 Tax=Moorena sp. SIO1F2 TaxID=2607819 RepID=UPI0013B5B582|nr:hypothetical protein [Moorena sp. SIO1F2]NET80881.1 hypothetical protein [Moorena sp. SIO1F2]
MALFSTLPYSRLDAVAHGGNPHRNGAFSVGELNSPRVAPLHRYSLLPTPYSLVSKT